MPRAARVCSTPGCPEITDGGRCPTCRGKAEQRRGTAAQRGYSGQHWRVRRRATLRRDPLCVCRDTTHPHGPQCLTPSTVADHHPRTRRELVAAGVPDPDALHLLRGICASCHNRHTGVTSPGGVVAHRATR